MIPEKAQTTYLDSKSTELRESTLRTHRYRLNHFVRWCDQQGIEDVDALTRPLVDSYAGWRKQDGDLSKTSLKSQVDTLRVFLKYLERVGEVDEDLHEAVPSISLTPEEASNERTVEPDTAREILDTLDRYHYASARHVWFLLAWRTSARISSLSALDVGDFDSDEQSLTYTNRTSTKLKNGGQGERPVALTDGTTKIVQEYLDENRLEVEDEEGRNPLFASSHGRVHRNTMRRWSYTLTCPSFHSSGECGDPDCDSQKSSKSSKCDESVSPHAIRRGSITHFLREDTPRKVVSDRANVSEAVLDKHYDRRTETEKMEQRRGYLDNI